MAVNHVRANHVRKYLDAKFAPYIDVDDIEHLSDDKIAEARRSRSLAVRYLSSPTVSTAAPWT